MDSQVFSKIWILIIIFIIGGILAWQYFGVLKEEVEDETTNWKTYRNEEYGFEIKYPKDWYDYGPYQNVEIISTFSKSKYEKYYWTIDVGKLGESYGLINITFPNITFPDKSLEEYFELKKRAMESLKKPASGYRVEEFIAEDTTVQGIKGYKIYYSGTSFYRFESGEESINIDYILPAKRKTGIIELDGAFKGPNGEEYANDFNQMLSTIQFLE